MAAAPTIRERIAMIDAIRTRPAGEPLPAPPFNRFLSDMRRGRVFFASETFSRHMTDEGWQIQLGLQKAGYALVGRYFDYDETDCRQVMRDMRPGVALMQDKREWDANLDGCFDKSISFQHSTALADDPAAFKLTIIKDAHSDPAYHRQAAEEIGCHAWISYYHPDIVCHLAPWVRREHVIRTWHSVDSAAVPVYSAVGRKGCLLSGAIDKSIYPLRARLKAAALEGRIPETTVLTHPTYHARGHCTPDYLKTLSKYKVAICTASVFGYALRKIIEAVACGCKVITDIPPDDPLPGGIDEALIRVSPEVPINQLAWIVQREIAAYDPLAQERYARAACEWFDWRRRGTELAGEIEKMRSEFCQ